MTSTRSEQRKAPRIWRIRAATPGDLEAVERILLECELPIEGVREYFEEAYCVAEDDGGIFGAGGVEPYGIYGLLRSVAVSPARREKSIGRALVLDRLRWAKSRGLFSLYLLTTTAPRFFERFGFRTVERDAAPPEIGDSSEFRSICPETATLMVLLLENARIPDQHAERQGEGHLERGES
jgi:amino-acid N-acetyltransferase